jgi:hypothetical protein
MIRFLEQDICSDARFFQFSIVFYRGCRNIDVDSADITVFMMHTVNGLDTFKDIFNGIIDGIFARFDCKAFVSLGGEKSILDL